MSPPLTLSFLPSSAKGGSQSHAEEHKQIHLFRFPKYVYSVQSFLSQASFVVRY
jgi:hypothetical protein